MTQYTSSLADMTFHYLQMLFPVLVALHNGEEAVSMPKWAQRSGPWFGGVQPAEFRFAAVVLTGFAFVVTALSTVSGRRTLWSNLTFGYIIAMVINALVPHIALSVAKRTVMPGVITAATLNLPILSFLAVLALKQGYVSNHDALVFGTAVPLVLLLVIPLLFRIGKLLAL